MVALSREVGEREMEMDIQSQKYSLDIPERYLTVRNVRVKAL